MTAIVTISNVEFPILNYRDQRVITTEHLAQLYGTETVRIRQNHARNPDRFDEGKHFFKAEGDELSSLKILGPQIDKRTTSLILWTERGAARHAKMLNTDQAWDVFEKLEAAYFDGVTPHAQPQPADPAALAQQLADLLKDKIAVDRAEWTTVRQGIDALREAFGWLDRRAETIERTAVRFPAAPREPRARQRPAAPPDPWEPQVRAYVAGRQEVTSTLVLTHLGVPTAEQTQVPKNRIAKILIGLGFVGYLVKRAGSTRRIWQRHHHA